MIDPFKTEEFEDNYNIMKDVKKLVSTLTRENSRIVIGGDKDTIDVIDKELKYRIFKISFEDDIEIISKKQVVEKYSTDDDFSDIKGDMYVSLKLIVDKYVIDSQPLIDIIEKEKEKIKRQHRTNGDVK